MCNSKYLGDSLDKVINDWIGSNKEKKELMRKQDLINSISCEIVKNRQKQKITQQELANKIKTKQSSISRIEKGNMNKLPTLEFLDKIATALNKELIVTFK